MTGKNLEENDRGLITLVSQNLPGGTEQNHEKLSQDSRCPIRDSNRSPIECKSTALPVPDLLGSVLLEKLIVVDIVKNFSAIFKPETSISYSQK
jgi:hypothetical protein